MRMCLREAYRIANSTVVICLLALPACSYRSQYPVLSLERDRDASLSCEELESELLRANALRDAILEEQGDVLAEDITTGTLDTASSILLDPVFGTITGVTTGVMGTRQYKRYQEAAIAAEARMIHVLTLREAKQCESGPSGDPTKTEQQILTELRVLDQQLSASELSKQAYHEERRELLDALR